MIKSAHDITLEAILSFFDFITSEPISYAARIVFETWKIENEDFDRCDDGNLDKAGDVVLDSNFDCESTLNLKVPNETSTHWRPTAY